ncbi:MAG: hypothetical protein JWN44_6184 [Myxococcales bacterium]|nr:hypothetical protein [Myxococcales bacterium]
MPRRMRILGLLVAAALAAFGMLAAGCGSRSEGQLGHASFAWQECPFGCSVTDNPMAAGGARAEISVSLASGYSFQQIRSSDPTIAAFSVGGSSNGLAVSVQSGTPGRAQLQLIDAKGKLVDEITVTVTATAKLAMVKGWSGTAPLVLEGSTQLFHVTTKDANDHTLVGTGAVTFALTDPLRTTAAIVFGDMIGFTGAAGAGTITARSDASTVVQPITVVPLSALTGLTATANANSVEGTSIFANVDVVANSATGSVYGAPCGWTVNDASVVVQSQTSASLEGAAKSTTKFKLGSAGTFTATCAIGAVSTSVQLHR